MSHPPRGQKNKPLLHAEHQQILADLNQNIQSLETAGNYSHAFMGRSTKGAFFYMQHQWRAAAREFGKAAQLAAAEDQAEPAAQAYLGQGLALENLPKKHQEAVAAFRRAATFFVQAGNIDAALDAYQRVAHSQARANRFEQAVAEMTTALEQLDETAHPQLVITIYRSRAKFRIMQSGPAGKEMLLALEDLEKAIGVAQNSQNPQAVLALRAEQNTIRQLKDEPDNLAGLSASLQEAAQLGHLATASDPRLQQAQQLAAQGKYEAALEMAEMARQDALHAQDLGRYTRYLLACVMIAGVREELGDHPGVIAILLTCKKTLTQDLGPEVGRQINRLLDALAERWGREGLMEALQTYREQVTPL